MSLPKKLSGWQNLKRKRERQEETAKGAKLLANFFKSDMSSEASTSGSIHKPSESLTSQPTFQPSLEETTKIQEEQISEPVEDLAVPGTFSSAIENFPSSSSNLPTQIVNYDDISNWPTIIVSATRDALIIRGPISNEMDNESYPRNKEGRHFSNVHFRRMMPNQEHFRRQWLVYSKYTDRVYCFCCRLFDKWSQSSLVKEGFNDWRHLTERLKMHETSSNHQRSLQSWMEASMRLRTFTGLDKALQKQIEDEKSRWVAVLERMMAITFFCQKIIYRSEEVLAPKLCSHPTMVTFWGWSNFLENLSTL